MAANIQIVPAQTWDVARVMTRLRAPDLREVLACCAARSIHIAQVIQSMIASLDNPRHHTWVVLADGQQLALLGVAAEEVFPTEACVWMLATPHLAKHKRQLYQVTADVLKQVWERVPGAKLYNWVSAENREAIHLLERLGFSIHRSTVVNMADVPFYYFEKEATENV